MVWRLRFQALAAMRAYAASAGGAITGSTAGSPYMFPAIDWLVDPKLAIVVAVGVPFGIAARSAYLIEKRVRWPNIRRDLIVSLLIAGGNFILALMISTKAGLGYLPSMALSFAICATGLKTTFDLARRWLDRLRPIDEQQGEKRQHAQIIQSAVRQAIEQDRHEQAEKERRDRLNAPPRGDPEGPE